MLLRWTAGAPSGIGAPAARAGPASFWLERRVHDPDIPIELEVWS